MGAFLGKRRESLRFRAARHIIYRACRPLSAPLRPSAPRVRALRRRPSARRPSPCEKPVVFRFSPPLFREKPTLPRNAPAFLSPPRRRARPRPRSAGEKFHIAAEKVRRNAHAFTFFFIFACFLCGENTLYLHRNPVLSTPHGKSAAVRPRFSLARRSAPPHSSPAYDASFRHPFAQCRLSGARPEHPGRHPGPASHFPAGTTSRHGATVTHRQPLCAEQRPAHRHLRRIGRHPPLRRLPAAQLERRHRTL